MSAGKRGTPNKGRVHRVRYFAEPTFLNMNTDQRIEQLFSLLTEWRAFPNYQLERRADIFFALYLKEILRDKYPDNEFELIIPEFPLRYGSIREEDQGNGANRSAKVDYVCVDRVNEFCVLLELKTEERSLRVDQFENMKNALKAGYAALLDGVRELIKHTKEKGKYTTLLKYLDAEVPTNAGAMARHGSGTPMSGMKMTIIKPTANESTCPEDCDVISFDAVAAALGKIAGPSDHLTQAFISALANWREPISR
jgi:hypothetical protein